MLKSSKRKQRSGSRGEFDEVSLSSSKKGAAKGKSDRVTGERDKKKSLRKDMDEIEESRQDEEDEEAQEEQEVDIEDMGNTPMGYDKEEDEEEDEF